MGYASLSQMVGEGSNRALAFGIESRGGEETPLVAIVLKEGPLVEIPVEQQKESIYEREQNGETLRVDTQTGRVEVVDDAGRVLSTQNYTPLYERLV